MEEEFKEGDEQVNLQSSIQRQSQEMDFFQMVESIRDQENEILILPNQPYRHTEIFKRSIKNNSQTLIIIKDITHIREKEMTKWQQKMQTVLLSSITHDLKTPLNSAIVFNKQLSKAKKFGNNE